MPESSQSFDIRVTYSPYKNRLDAINIPGLTGCEGLARVIAKAGPLLCVFGHYHYSWGIEKVPWQEGHPELDDLPKAEEQQEFDFSGNGPLGSIAPGKETIFVNVAWMTMQKTTIVKRSPPFAIVLASKVAPNGYAVASRHQCS